MTQFLIVALSLAASTAALAGTPCSKADLMSAVHKAYGPEFKFASGNDGSSDEATFVRHSSNDQYVFWVDKNGNTFKAVVTSKSGSCTHLRAFVDLQNGE